MPSPLIADQPREVKGNAPPAGPYASGVRVGNLLFVSGQGPFDREGGRVGETFSEQAHATFDNIAHIALAGGTSLDHVVKLGCFMTGGEMFTENFAAWNAVCDARLGRPYPARTTVLAELPGFDIEIDAVIWVPETASVDEH